MTLGWSLKLRRRVDHPQQLHHADDAIEAAKLGAQRREDGQPYRRAAARPSSSVRFLPTRPVMSYPSLRKGP